MLRKIIKIDEEACDGCGLCVDACHEGAIGLVNGKAKLLRDDYCDGLGDCLPACPTGAISFEEREAAAYDEAAVQANLSAKQPLACGCPGTAVEQFNRSTDAPVGSMCPSTKPVSNVVEPCEQPGQIEQRSDSDQGVQMEPISQLAQWPIQIKLVPVNAPYFDGANLLIAADCVAYAYAGFHDRFMKDHITVIGCPKLDQVDYTEKLSEIIAQNNIKSVTVARMVVPCCGGLENAAKNAIADTGKEIPFKVVTLSTDGTLL